MMQKTDDNEFSASQSGQVLLTIIIPTLNESAYLPTLMNALERQIRKADEIIVADAGSGDETPELAKKHGARVVNGGLPAIGRNAGARIAKGDYLLFLDADVVPAPDFISKLLTEFENKNLDVATCYISSLGENPLDRVICEGTNCYFRIIQPVSPHAPGFCILSRRSKHEEIGGFDETLLLSEDIDYARRAKQNGKFGIITSTRIPVSMRRVGQEGLVRLGLKYAWCEMFALAGKPVRKLPFSYDFGKFTGSQISTQRPVIKMRLLDKSFKKIRAPILKVRWLLQEKFNLY